MRRQSSHRGPGHWRYLGIVLGALTIAWVAGLALFVQKIPRAPAGTEMTDAVVVLTGGFGRIARGTELLAEGKAREMLISGVGQDVPMADLISEKDLEPRLIACCVTLGRAARDTRENAIEAAGWIAHRPITSIRLVTSDFHMPRSLLEFGRRLPHLQILPDPVAAPNIRLDQWWSRPGTAWLLAGEYTKYLAIRTQMIASRLRDRALS